MSVERTFSIIKPDAVAAGHAGEILAAIEAAGFKILALRMTRLSEPQARGFYAVHAAKPFYAGLVKFMTEGPIIVMALERENAIAGLREVMGATNPEKAAEGTIQKTLRHQHRAQLHSRERRGGDSRGRVGVLLWSGGIAVRRFPGRSRAELQWASERP
jgi:nucleoside-diphosphate kinase